MTIKEFFSFKQNKFFWINLIAMVIVVALVLFGVLKGLDIYTRHGEAGSSAQRERYGSSRS